mmetsp:Transcript_4031/g.4640  ORF Transcript_4031/g.4640 Transcript_4031/m.4640 type:complete len:106 (-) Transcript_4031:112-429(-)
MMLNIEGLDKYQCADLIFCLVVLFFLTLSVAFPSSTRVFGFPKRDTGEMLANLFLFILSLFPPVTLFCRHHSINNISLYLRYHIDDVGALFCQVGGMRKHQCWLG